MAAPFRVEAAGAELFGQAVAVEGGRGEYEPVPVRVAQEGQQQIGVRPAFVEFVEDYGRETGEAIFGEPAEGDP